MLRVSRSIQTIGAHLAIFGITAARRGAWILRLTTFAQDDQLAFVRAVMTSWRSFAQNDEGLVLPPT